MLKRLWMTIFCLGLCVVARGQDSEYQTGDLERFIEALSLLTGGSDTLPAYRQSAVCGMLIEYDKFTPKVVLPYGGSQAEKVGVQSGDEMLRINDKFVKYEDDTVIARQLAMPAGTEIRLTVARAGHNPVPPCPKCGDKAFVMQSSGSADSYPGGSDSSRGKTQRHVGRH